MSHTRSAQLAPVLPCVAFNQSSCLSESCAFSHLPDSFSLGSGRRNVCLLYLMGRCDGWGCSYSHARDELDWTDDEVKTLVHAHMQLIDAHNGRIARNPTSFPLLASLPSHPVSWNQVAAPQQYPTPSSSIAIDPASVESEPVGDPYLGQQQPSWSAEQLRLTENDSPQHAPAVSPDPASDVNSEGVVNAKDNPQETREMKTPPVVSLNPLAIPFVPSRYKAAPIDEPPVTTLILEPEITPSPVESEIWRSPATDAISKVTIQDHGGECETPVWSWNTPEVSKVATKDDIDTWGAVPKGSSWGDTPADDWASPTGDGGWNAGPSDDAFKTPPRTAISPTPARKARETFKSKEKPTATTSWRDRKPSESQAMSESQKGRSRAKKPAKLEKFSSRKHERRQSTPSITQKKNDSRRSLVTIHNEATPFIESWREGPPHKTPEVEDEERAKLYEIKVQPGSIIPPKEVVTKIAKAHIQLAREKAPSFENTQVTEESSPVDPGTNWVNGGPSRQGGQADPPREFSQRSRPAGSTWGKDSGWPKLSE